METRRSNGKPKGLNEKPTRIKKTWKSKLFETLHNLLLYKNSSDWQSFEKGGVEFPVTDFANKFGTKADHFWACGFGTVMPDRLYHANIKTGDRWVYKVV